MPPIPPPDEILLRRFGFVRAVGGAAYFVAVIVQYTIFGTRMWPLALGVPVLAVVTTWYFVRSSRYPRTAVIVSLAADALVLGGAIAFLGGTGSGLVMLYTIVVVSAGILLGPGAAAAFTALTTAMAFVQLLLEELGYPPVLLHRPELEDRLPILLVSVAGLLSVGYLTATYASRLHELIAEAGQRFEVERRRGRRRRSLQARATVDVREPLQEMEALADRLDGGDSDVRAIAGHLRMAVAALDAELEQLSDLGALDEEDRRPVPVRLRSVVDDCLIALEPLLANHAITVDVAEHITVVGDRRAARRIVLNLLENIVQHTPPGTAGEVRALVVGGATVLAVSDSGPGIPSDIAKGLFLPPPEHRGRKDEPVTKVGLPLAAELASRMGAELRYEPSPTGGSRFLVKLRSAPSGAADEVLDGADDSAVAGRADAG